MSTRRSTGFASVFLWLALLSPVSASMNLSEYAGVMVSEAFLGQPIKPTVSVALVGSTPPLDRQVISTFLAPFNWVTDTSAQLSGIDEADFVVIHIERFGSLLDSTHADGRIADVVRRNQHHLRAGGPCTKIIATQPDGGVKSYVFLTLEEDDERRKTCLYAQMRSLFGLGEAGSGERRFADVFLSDLVLARCIRQVKADQPLATASEKKAEILRRLESRACGG